MNILILSHKPPYPIIDGGCHAMDRFVRGLLISFPKATIDYLCISTQKHPFKAESIPEDLKTRIEFKRVVISTRLNPISAFLHVLSNKSYQLSRFKQREVLNHISSIVKNKDLDFLFFESLFCGAYMNEIKKLTEATRVYRAHNVEHLIWEKLSDNARNPFKKWYFKHLSQTLKSFELDFLSKNHHVLSIAPSDVQYFKAQKLKNVSYIPVSMTTSPIKETKAKSICFLGAYNWLPNKEGILWFNTEVLPSLLKQTPELTLHVAGSFSEQIEVLKKTEAIEMHGFVPSSKDFISNHGLFVAPILSGSGVKMKVLEAMSLGVPCILSAHAADGLALPEIIPICQNNKDFITQVSLLLHNEALAKEIGLAGQEYIKHNYSSELVSNEIIDTLSRQ